MFQIMQRIMYYLLYIRKILRLCWGNSHFPTPALLTVVSSYSLSLSFVKCTVFYVNVLTFVGVLHACVTYRLVTEFSVNHPT
jgi:hypothetical protein